MRRIAFFAIFLALTPGVFQAHLHGQSQAPEAPGSARAAQQISREVAEAEAAIVKSDWKAAETKLNAWLSAHPTDARALFDAGYVADAQDHLDDAAAFYRRAVEANPNSFEAHLSLGLLLARQGKPAEARPELLAATTLDPGEAGPALKARAWRALAQIDSPTAENPGNTVQASNDLLEALKLSPETPADTLLAANLAEASGNYDAAEAAYRRLLASDPKSAQANSGLAHVLIVRKQFPEAEKLIRAALEQNPDNPVLSAQLATVLAAQDNAEALPLLQKLPCCRIRRMLRSLACWLTCWPMPAMLQAPTNSTSLCWPRIRTTLLFWLRTGKTSFAS